MTSSDDQGQPSSVRAGGLSPLRDTEAERYELQAQRERDEALGQALFEHRRPNAPKAWEELAEDDRTEWILIAVDQARGITSGTTATVDAAVRAAEPVDSRVPDLAEKLRRVWMSGRPIEPGGRIDWTRFAEALVHDEGVRPR